MLRLHIAQAMPWVDSQGQIRSPYEGVSLLEARAAQFVEQGLDGLAGWRIGVLSDDEPPPQWAKPILVGEGSLETSATCYTLGERAREYVEHLKPFLHDFLVWLRARYGSPVLLLKDHVPRVGGPPLELSEAIVSGMQRVPKGFLALRATSGFLVADQEPRTQDEFLDLWWPSPLGVLGGLVFRESTSDQARRRILGAGRISAEDLEEVKLLFETSDLFENLGFFVLSRGAWAETQSALDKGGWLDGMPLNG
jgi:hypothetical protein